MKPYIDIAGPTWNGMLKRYIVEWADNKPHIECFKDYAEAEKFIDKLSNKEKK